MSTAERVTTLPPLEAGQRLDQTTFHERYEAMPPGIKAELIGGVVYMPSPVRRRHAQIALSFATVVGIYQSRTPGREGNCDATTELDELGEPQPDISLRILPSHGGQTWDSGKYIGGAPELIAEVSESTRSVDLGPKKLDYERAGTLEYVVFGLSPDEVFWHVRQGDRLVRVSADADEIYRSATFPGLWVDPRALFGNDLAGLIATLERGLATPEHVAFIANLQHRKG